MRKRTMMLCGPLAAGPRPGGGAEVAAYTPVPTPAGVPDGDGRVRTPDPASEPAAGTLAADRLHG
jgi:hypothetical protein